MGVRTRTIRSSASLGCAITISFAFSCASTATEAPPPEPVATVHHHHHHHHHGDGGVAEPSTVATTEAQPEASAAPVETPPPETAPADGGVAEQGALATVTGPAPSTAGAGGSTATFGSPVVQHPAEAPAVRPRWFVNGGAGRLVCQGNESLSSGECPQCPDNPTNAEIVRAFLPFEHPVLACAPPANERGQLAMHATFNSAGAPIDFTFPGVAMTRAIAHCIGRSLCQVRVPTFRAVAATVDYEYVVMLPDTSP